MADGFYLLGIDAIFQGSIDVLTDTIKALFVDETAYTPNLATDEFLDDIPGGAQIDEFTLTGKTMAGGVFDAADISAGSTAAGTGYAIVLYQDTGVASTSRLIYRIDTSPGLPVVLGGSLDVAWDPGGIFQIANTATEEIGVLRYTTSVLTVSDNGYTMTAGEAIRFDASGGAFQVFLPSSPARDQRVAFSREHPTDATTLTIQGNGSNIRPPLGGAVATSITLSDANEYLELAYNGNEWTPAS